jgi:hypothetical protein
MMRFGVGVELPDLVMIEHLKTARNALSAFSVLT